LAIRPFVTLAVLLVLIPIASEVLLKTFKISNTQKDLMLVRGSATLLTIGTLLLGLSKESSVAVLSLLIFALGNGFTTVSKSLLTTFGPHEMAGTLLSAMNVSAALGAMIAGPIISITFNLGLSWGGAWIGAPLFFMTVLYASTLASVCMMKASDALEDDSQEEPAS
jgi:MFS family permease